MGRKPVRGDLVSRNEESAEEKEVIYFSYV